MSEPLRARRSWTASLVSANGALLVQPRPLLALEAGISFGVKYGVETLPHEVVAECVLIHRAMEPRCEVWLYLPNRDRCGCLIDIDEIAVEVEARIRDITGGRTTFYGTGEFVPSFGAVMDEDTSVIETLLPKLLTDAQRDELIRLFIAFGFSANQEVVQVKVLGHGYWIPTGALLEAARVQHPEGEGGALHAG